MLYLLSTQVLLDILGKQSPGTQWMTTAPAGSVEISVVSIGQAQRYIGKLSSASEREKLMRALRRIEATVTGKNREHEGVVPFDGEAARIWAELADADLPYIVRNPGHPEREVPLGATGRMVVATALARSGTLIEAPQPYHERIARLLVEHP